MIKRSPKHVDWDEVSRVADGRRPVLVYQHCGRRKREEHISALRDRLHQDLPDGYRALGLRGKHGAFIAAATGGEHDGMATAFADIRRRWGL